MVRDLPSGHSSGINIFPRLSAFTGRQIGKVDTSVNEVLAKGPYSAETDGPSYKACLYGGVRVTEETIFVGQNITLQRGYQVETV